MDRVCFDARMDAVRRPDEPVDPVAVLRRWEAGGGGWRVEPGARGELTVVLLTCDGGEEMDRLTSADADLAAYLDGRTASDG